MEPATPIVLGEGLALRQRPLKPAACCGGSFLVEGLHRRLRHNWCRQVEGLAVYDHGLLEAAHTLPLGGRPELVHGSQPPGS